MYNNQNITVMVKSQCMVKYDNLSNHDRHYTIIRYGMAHDNNYITIMHLKKNMYKKHIYYDSSLTSRIVYYINKTCFLGT